MTRPDPPKYGPEEGFEARAVRVRELRYDGDRWSTDARLVAGKRCRYGSQWRGFCGKPAVAVLDRAAESRRARGLHSWYGYCGDPVHLYGRWIEDGEVWCWVFRRIGAPT